MATNPVGTSITEDKLKTAEGGIATPQVYYNGGWQTALPTTSPYYVDPWLNLHTGVDEGNGTTFFSQIAPEQNGTAQLLYDWNGDSPWLQANVNQNATYNGQQGFTVNDAAVGDINQYMAQGGRDNSKFAAKSGSVWDDIRDAVEAVGSVVGNYFLPGSSLVTDQLVSKGAQQDLNTPLGQIANIASGAGGVYEGNLSNYGNLWDAATGATPAATAADPLSEFVPTVQKAAETAGSVADPLSEFVPTATKAAETAGGIPGVTDVTDAIANGTTIPNPGQLDSLNNVISSAAGEVPKAGLGGWTTNLGNSSELVNVATGQTFNPTSGSFGNAGASANSGGASSVPGASASPGASATPASATPPAALPPGNPLANGGSSLPLAPDPSASSIPSWLSPFLTPQGLAALGSGALALGAGSGSGSSGSAANSQAQLAQTQQNLANDLIAKWQSGQITPADAQTVSQFRSNSLAQTRQYYANAGLSDSSMAVQAEQDVNAKADAMQSQFLNTMLTQAINALSGASASTNAAVQTQIQQDNALNSAYSNFFTNLSKLGTTSTPTTSTDTQGGANAGSGTT